MKFNTHILHRILTGLLLCILSVFVIAMFLVIYQAVVMDYMEWPFLLAPVPFTLMLLSAKYQSAPGELTPEGVYVRHFFRRRFYAWSEIRQAGILGPRGRNNCREIILVKPGGTPRRPGDDTNLFLLRNTFRLIFIPHDGPEEAYVRKYYGKLDFNRYGL